MSSRIRVLAESNQIAPLAELRTVLGPEFDLVVADGDEANWSQLLLRDADGSELAAVERRSADSEAGKQEIEHLSAKLEGARPTRAVEWLRHYFSHVKVVYAMKPYPTLPKGREGWATPMLRIQAYFWKKFGGILQADDEGFSNREGYHVVWQFHGPQQGELEAAVMDDSGKWVGFVLDMGDPEQVAAFQRGEVPAGAVRHG